MTTDLVRLIERFGSEDKCRECLETMRWPHGVKCPRCQSDKISRILARHQFDCDACRYQFSVTAGTVFNDSHLPLWKWFLAAYLLCESRKGMSANQLKRVLGLGSYKTAWYLCQRIRSAMREASHTKLDGVVEIDETYIGGKKRGSETGRGRGVDGKETVIGIRQRGGDVRYIHTASLTSDTLYKLIHENVSEDASAIMTDEFPGYPGAMGTDFKDKHHTIRHKDKVYVRGEVHTNTVESAFSLFKRGVIGTWHQVSAKHLQRYLDEMQFRFNRRKSEVLFEDTLRHMVSAPVLTFQNLTA